MTIIYMSSIRWQSLIRVDFAQETRQNTKAIQLISYIVVVGN